jgi:hypothetical protein
VLKKREWLWAVAALGVLATGCASSSQAQRADSGAEQKAAELEAKNRELEAQLAQKNQAIEAAFRQATQAENSAGLVNLGCAGVTPAAAPAPGMPRSGAQHLQLGLARKAFRMTSTFQGPRTVGGWRVSQGTCQVVPQ